MLTTFYNTFLEFGAAWWHLDSIQGIEAQLQTLCNAGMLADFVGMLTDSRSYLSYVRHDYFRRVLCAFIGRLAHRGEWLGDMAATGAIVAGICGRNIHNYLGL